VPVEVPAGHRAEGDPDAEQDGGRDGQLAQPAQDERADADPAGLGALPGLEVDVAADVEEQRHDLQ
jgi:hypothetical protein